MEDDILFLYLDERMSCGVAIAGDLSQEETIVVARELDLD